MTDKAAHCAACERAAERGPDASLLELLLGDGTVCAGCRETRRPPKQEHSE